MLNGLPSRPVQFRRLRDKVNYFLTHKYDTATKRTLSTIIRDRDIHVYIKGLISFAEDNHTVGWTKIELDLMIELLAHVSHPLLSKARISDLQGRYMDIVNNEGDYYKNKYQLTRKLCMLIREIFRGGLRVNHTTK